MQFDTVCVTKKLILKFIWSVKFAEEFAVPCRQK